MFKKRRRKIFVNRSKKDERQAIADSLKRIIGAQSYYNVGPIRL